ncbi:hypothetical protein Taro_009019 [Colocasia esculenta]|uniref:Uncharacterized protein n=1 Tax=Colocasia esculenta TaxID=4460 RepID=A0A843U4L5_COLES|nr:hypothetical protein [Colocasia esculenta]
MEKMMKKLALWHTKTFRPIMTHDELEPIMAVLGFVALPLPPPSAATPQGGAAPAAAAPWREYSFHVVVPLPGERRHPQPPPARPRLPSPRIDGLHLLTYRAFIDAVGYFIGADKVADHFHVRSMPLHRVHDRVFDKVFRHMSDDRRGGDDEGLLVYREGTLDQTTLLLCGGSNTASAGGSGNNSPAPNLTCMVSLSDIIPPMKDIAV